VLLNCVPSQLLQIAALAGMPVEVWSPGVCGTPCAVLQASSREEVKATLKSERAKMPRRRLTNRRPTSRCEGCGHSAALQQPAGADPAARAAVCACLCVVLTCLVGWLFGCLLTYMMGWGFQDE